MTKTDSNIEFDIFVKLAESYANATINYMKLTASSCEVDKNAITKSHRDYLVFRDNFKRSTSECFFMIDRHKIAAMFMISLVRNKVIVGKQVDNDSLKSRIEGMNNQVAISVGMALLAHGYKKENGLQISLKYPKTSLCREEDSSGLTRRDYSDNLLALLYEAEKHIDNIPTMAAFISSILFDLEKINEAVHTPDKVF